MIRQDLQDAVEKEDQSACIKLEADYSTYRGMILYLLNISVHFNLKEKIYLFFSQLSKDSVKNICNTCEKIY